MVFNVGCRSPGRPSGGLPPAALIATLRHVRASSIVEPRGVDSMSWGFGLGRLGGSLPENDGGICDCHIP